MLRIVLALMIAIQTFPAGGQQQAGVRRKAGISHPGPKLAANDPLLFRLWEAKDDLRKRAGMPQEYFVPAVEKLIKAGDLRYYEDTYKRVDDVFYRETPAGRVRILVAYAADESQSHLNPEIRVEKLHFLFDKEVSLRKALAAIAELRELCAGGCILNGFSSTVVAQPASPTEAQIAIARRMKPHWRGQDMSDATPGAEVFYLDSPYPVDFEHSPVERIDYTLTSNAGREQYTLRIVNKEPTVLDIWHPKTSDFQVASKDQ
jgi:hypothetical protein